MEITLWYRKTKDSETNEYIWDYNHYENGFKPDQTHPTPKTSEHKSWAKGQWLGKKAKLIDGKVIKDSVMKAFIQRNIWYFIFTGYICAFTGMLYIAAN